MYVSGQLQYVYLYNLYVNIELSYDDNSSKLSSSSLVIGLLYLRRRDKRTYKVIYRVEKGQTCIWFLYAKF